MTDASFQPQDGGMPSGLILALFQLAAAPAGLEGFLKSLDAAMPDLKAAGSAAASLREGPARLALELLQRSTHRRAESDAAEAFTVSPGVAAFLADGGPQVARCNAAATAALGLQEGGALAALPLEPADLARLRQGIRAVADGKSPPLTLRFQQEETAGPLVLRICPAGGLAFPPRALVVVNALAWSEALTPALREAFGLSTAETQIAIVLAQGHALTAIAAARGRSEQTVRTQLRTILSKTGTHSQADLMRCTLTLLQMAGTGPAAAGEPQSRVGPEPFAGVTRLESHILRLPGGRQLEWIEFGAPGGRPVLYLHSDWGLARWPAGAERAAQMRGLRILVPFRPGYGLSSPLAAETGQLDGVTATHIALLDHLGLRNLPVLTCGSDLRYALNLAERRPDLIASALACGPILPFPQPFAWDRLQGWPRWLRSAARVTPELLPLITAAGLAGGTLPEALLRDSPADRPLAGQPEVRAALSAGMRQTLLRPGSDAAASLAAGLVDAEEDPKNLFQQSSLPLHLIRGALDPWDCPALSSAQRLRRSQTVHHLIPGAGHLVFFSHWQECLSHLQSMVESGRS